MSKPRQDKKMIVVSTQLPFELCHWMDLHIAQLRLATLRAGNEDALVPSRSGFICDLVRRARNNATK